MRWPTSRRDRGRQHAHVQVGTPRRIRVEPEGPRGPMMALAVRGRPRVDYKNVTSAKIAEPFMPEAKPDTRAVDGPAAAGEQDD